LIVNKALRIAVRDCERASVLPLGGPSKGESFCLGAVSYLAVLWHAQSWPCQRFRCNRDIIGSTLDLCSEKFAVDRLGCGNAVITEVIGLKFSAFVPSSCDLLLGTDARRQRGLGRRLRECSALRLYCPASDRRLLATRVRTTNSEKISFLRENSHAASREDA